LGVLTAILKMADILKILKTQNCSSNGDHCCIFSSTSNLIFIPWVGIEPTYQKQQVISLLYEKKHIYMVNLAIFILIFTPPQQLYKNEWDIKSTN
jgi:hypothetical protein